MDMTIGVVKEIKNNEFRVGLTPDAVSAFVQAGHPVLVEKGAGLGSGFPDEEYVQAGATLEDTAEAVWNKSGMIVKVKEIRGVTLYVTESDAMPKKAEEAEAPKESEQ